MPSGGEAGLERQMEWQTDLNSDAGTYTVEVQAINIYGAVAASVSYQVIVELNCEFYKIIPASIADKTYQVGDPEI